MITKLWAEIEAEKRYWESMDCQEKLNHLNRKMESLERKHVSLGDDYRSFKWNIAWKHENRIKIAKQVGFTVLCILSGIGLIAIIGGLI